MALETDESHSPPTPSGVEYVVGDAGEVLNDLPAESAQLIHLDDAWARPKRGDAFGVTYDTHPFDREDQRVQNGEMDPDVTTDELLAACERVLAPGGVLLMDTDDWLIAQMLPYMQREWGDPDREAGEKYVVGQVVECKKDGHPDRSTPGMYLSTGGYSVLMAFKQACPVDVPAGQRAFRQRENFEWGSAKPLRPYEQWVKTFTNPGDTIVVPCAGTSPTAIAAERIHGEQATVLSVDVEADARNAYHRRRAAELDREFEPIPVPDDIAIDESPADVNSETFGAEKRTRGQTGLSAFKTQQATTDGEQR